MPQNIHQPAANSPSDWYFSLPPITRLYGTVCVAATLLSVLGLLNPIQLFLSWPLIVGKLQVTPSLFCIVGTETIWNFERWQHCGPLQ